MREHNLYTLIDGIVKSNVDRIHTTTLAKIVKYDPLKMVADIQLLEKVEHNGKVYDAPQVVSCLVSYKKGGAFYIRTPYNEGDLVVVAFCETTTDNVRVSGEQEYQDDYRKHSFDDAIIMGSWKSENEADMSSENVEDLLIVNKDATSKIVFKKDGEVEINNGTTVSIKPSGEVTIISSKSVDIDTDEVNVTAKSKASVVVGTTSLEASPTAINGTSTTINFKSGASSLMVDASGITATPMLTSPNVQAGVLASGGMSVGADGSMALTKPMTSTSTVVASSVAVGAITLEAHKHAGGSGSPVGTPIP